MADDEEKARKMLAHMPTQPRRGSYSLYVGRGRVILVDVATQDDHTGAFTRTSMEHALSTLKSFNATSDECNSSDFEKFTEMMKHTRNAQVLLSLVTVDNVTDDETFGNITAAVTRFALGEYRMGEATSLMSVGLMCTLLLNPHVQKDAALMAMTLRVAGLAVDRIASDEQRLTRQHFLTILGLCYQAPNTRMRKGDLTVITAYMNCFTVVQGVSRWAQIPVQVVDEWWGSHQDDENKENALPYEILVAALAVLINTDVDVTDTMRSATVKLCKVGGMHPSQTCASWWTKVDTIGGYIIGSSETWALLANNPNCDVVIYGEDDDDEAAAAAANDMDA
jgi:hypothetical protein